MTWYGTGREFDTVTGGRHDSAMKRSSIRPGRTTLASWLLVLMLAPMALPAHAHAEDHDDDEPHVEAPHHEHALQRVADTDQVPSGQLKLSVDACAAPMASGPTNGQVVRGRTDRRAHDAPARAPPTSTRSRAPPISI